MDYQEQILAFLQKPENLPVAMEVAKHVESLRTYLHRAFWKDIILEFKTRLAGSPTAERWVVLAPDTEFDRTYKNIRIHVKSIPDYFKETHLTLCLMQATPPAYRLAYGLCWSLKERPVPGSALFKTLIDLSNQAGLSEKNQNPWWPVVSNLDIYPRSDEFMLQYGLQPAEFIDGLADKVWDYFTTIEPTLYQLNQELFQGE